MAKKEDIGKLFEDKLSDGKKAPNTSLWGKIKSSLDEEKRRRRRFILYCLVGGSLSILLGWYILFGNGIYMDSVSPVQKEVSPSFENSCSNEKDKTEFKNHQNNTLNTTNETKEKLTEIPVRETLPENDNKEIIEKTSKVPFNLTSGEKNNTNSKIKDMDDTFSVTKKYYYYNSRDGKQIVTTNKKEIDSLVTENNKKIDSLSKKTTDSLRR